MENHSALCPARLKDPTNNGIFESDPAAYSAYAVWADRIIAKLRSVIEQGRLNSFINLDDLDRLEDFWPLVDKNPERSFNLVLFDMLENGASWHHLLVLSKIAKFSPIPDHHKGRFALQIADWIVWHSAIINNV